MMAWAITIGAGGQVAVLGALVGGVLLEWPWVVVGALAGAAAAAVGVMVDRVLVRGYPTTRIPAMTAK